MQRRPGSPVGPPRCRRPGRRRAATGPPPAGEPPAGAVGHGIGVRAPSRPGVGRPVEDPERVAHRLVGHVGVAQADLVALVEHRRAPEAEQHEQGHPGPAGSPPAHRVANRHMSWFEPVHTGQAPAGSAPRSPPPRAAWPGLQRRADEREVEGQVQLVAARRRSTGRATRRPTGVSPTSTLPGYPSANLRHCLMTSWTSGRLAVVDRPLAEELDVIESVSSVAGGLSRSSASLTMMLHTSMRKPATPRSSQNPMMSSKATRTSSSHQLRSGCSRRWLWR